MKIWTYVFLFFVLTQTAIAAQDPLPTLREKPAAPTTDTAGKPAVPDQSFLEKYPNLKQNLYKEPNSNLYLGFSLGLLGVVKDRMFFSANFFQVHYMTSFWDAEVFSVSYGTTTANPSYVQSNHFVFRTIPKYRINDMLSVGPLLGYEFVSFPKISAVLYDGTYQTKTEPLSTSGMIYGVGASQNMTTEKGWKVKINEVIYKETYSTTDAGKGWMYLPDLRALRTDTTPIDAGVMFMIEVGILL